MFKIPLHVHITHLTLKSFGFEVRADGHKECRFRIEYPYSVFGLRGLASGALAAIAPKYFLAPYLSHIKLFVNDEEVLMGDAGEILAVATSGLKVFRTARRTMTLRELFTRRGLSKAVTHVIEDINLAKLLKRFQ